MAALEKNIKEQGHSFAATTASEKSRKKEGGVGGGGFGGGGEKSPSKNPANSYLRGWRGEKNINSRKNATTLAPKRKERREGKISG